MLGLMAFSGLTTALIFSGCGSPGSNATAENSAGSRLQSPAPIERDSNGWSVSSVRATDDSVRLKKSEMPQDQVETMRREYRQTDLIAIPVSPKYNVSLFQIKNVSEWENTVFIAPKLFAYGSAEKGRIAPERNPDGTVTLSFPVVLTDAADANVTSPSASEKINLPDTIAIHQFDELRTEIYRRYSSSLAPLPGCPKQIIVKVNDAEYDATPRDLAKGDYCQMNTPFTASIRVPEEKARFILQKALYANAVDIRAVYETRVAFTVSRFNLEFDRSKLFREIESELSIDAGPWADADVHAKVTNAVRRQAMKVQVQGDMNSHLEGIVSQAVGLFFERFSPDPRSGLKSCGDALVCLRLNYNYSKEEQSLSVGWQQSTSAQTGQNYITWTKLKALTDKVVDIGAKAERPPLKNDGSSIETGLTVVSGDLLEITPSFLIRELREFDQIKTSRASHSVCVASDGDRCTRTEDHWTETSTYSYSAPQYKAMNEPIGQLQQIFDGLVLKFTWRNDRDGALVEKSCPLNIFERDGDGKSLTVRLENHPTCQIFTADMKSKPMLHLVNGIQFPVKYRSGQEVRLWNGQVIQSPEVRTYSPQVEFAGTVAIKGYDIGSAFSGGTRLN